VLQQLNFELQRDSMSQGVFFGAVSSSARRGDRPLLQLLDLPADWACNCPVGSADSNRSDGMSLWARKDVKYVKNIQNTSSEECQTSFDVLVLWVDVGGRLSS
jgi:hypothetical protein